MLGKQAIADFLKQNNINNIFYLPGIHTLPLSEGFIKDNINALIGRYESDLIYMADGYSRATGKVGVVFITPGPGLGNVVSGCMEAHGDDTPLIIIHIDTKREEHGRGILHELREPENIFRHFTKKTFYISSVDELVPVLDKAYNTAISDRKGPVVVSVPFVFLEKEISGEKLEKNQVTNLSPKSEAEDIQLIVQKIEEALRGKKKPVIIAGKSFMFNEARHFLDNVCGGGSIPFFTTTGGKGIVNEKNIYAFGNVMQKGITNRIIKDADIVIAIGTRLRDVDAKRRGVKINELIHIDIDDFWIGKNYSTHIKLSDNLYKILGLLDNTLKNKTFDWDLVSLKNEQKKERERLSKDADGFKIIKTIRDAIPADTITVWDLNLISYWAEYYFPVYSQRSFIMPRGISPIFYALPASIGAKIGMPDLPCLCVCGDGGIMPTISELSIIKRYNIPVVVLVYNNESFGILEDIMQKRYKVNGSMQLTNPDFIKIARAFGIKAKRTRTVGGLKDIFLNQITWAEPFLIEFNFPIFPPPWDT